MANGVNKYESLPTCTEKLCGWAEPKGSKSEPDTFDNFKIGMVELTAKRTADSNEKKLSLPKPPSFDAVAELHLNLINVTHHLGQYCPAVHVLNPSRFRKEPSNEAPPKPINMEDTMDLDSEMLVYSSEVTIVNTPLPVTRIEHKWFRKEGEPGFKTECSEFVKKAASHSCQPWIIEEVT